MTLLAGRWGEGGVHLRLPPNWRLQSAGHSNSVHELAYTCSIAACVSTPCMPCGTIPCPHTPTYVQRGFQCLQRCEFGVNICDMRTLGHSPATAQALRTGEQPACSRPASARVIRARNRCQLKNSGTYASSSIQWWALRQPYSIVRRKCVAGSASPITTPGTSTAEPLDPANANDATELSPAEESLQLLEWPAVCRQASGCGTGQGAACPCRMQLDAHACGSGPHHGAPSPAKQCQLTIPLPH